MDPMVLANMYSARLRKGPTSAILGVYFSKIWHIYRTQCPLKGTSRQAAVRRSMFSVPDFLEIEPAPIQQHDIVNVLLFAYLDHTIFSNSCRRMM